MNVIDKVESAKHALTGSGIGRAVSKATSHEIIGPKRKHVDCELNFVIFNCKQAFKSLNEDHLYALTRI